ncbi:predicted protein [Naegleria gruberi]|uniref:Predicted protein n=1 Tax=Naegleria gruberi TaxID=5762 RepID=D2VM47_NAEGR|nr:uncharacterized protein NAEGRDRAFT_70008 [Naegleria gruberi]EFC42165.1 predicted protein [Naegleria gruberi]|eukprot:XP_002674909.1 predicted protein [Naegleria gruberi strain NEG-M]
MSSSRSDSRDSRDNRDNRDGRDRDGGRYNDRDYHRDYHRDYRGNNDKHNYRNVAVYEIPTPLPTIDVSSSDIDKTPHLIFSKYSYVGDYQWPETPNNHIRRILSKYSNAFDQNKSEYSPSAIANMDHGKYVYILMYFQSNKKFYVDALFKFSSEGDKFMQDNPKMKHELKYFIYFFRIVSIVNALKHNRAYAENIEVEPIYKKATETLQESLKNQEINQKQFEHYLCMLKLWFANYLDVSEKPRDDALFYYKEVLMFCLQHSPFTEDLYFKTVYNLAIYFIKLKLLESAIGCFESLFYIATAENRLSKYLSTKTRNIGRLAYECSDLLYKNGEKDRAKDIINKVLDKKLSSDDYARDLRHLLNKI